MKQTLNKAVKATNGRKTYITAILYLIVAVFGDKVDFLRDNQIIIDNILQLAFSGGIGHKLIKKIWPFINKYLKRKK